MNHLYYGDNLHVLRDSIKDESVDLIYLDPPFNSKRDYNQIFKAPDGSESHAQIEAFEDTWHWGEQAEREYDEIVHCSNTDVSDLIQAYRSFLGENDVMAYLVMMANRLLELHRVLKSTGSIYLHCDPTAGHYLKLVLDAVFGVRNYKNEIVWKRTSAHNDSKRWGNVHDTIFFYTKTDDYCWNIQYQEYDESYLDTKYKNQDAKGRYRLGDLTGSGTTAGESCKPWRGFSPLKLGRHWGPPTKIIEEKLGKDAAAAMSTQEKLDWLDDNGYIYWTPRGKGGGAGFPQYKRYLKDGVPIQDMILDIAPVNSQAAERLGYPTQKPISLLERILNASTNPGDVVMDPFCGCGTAVHAAQKLDRLWIGIDITHLAISLIEKRLKDAFPSIKYNVEGTPKDFEGAKDLFSRDAYQFQWWACSLVGAAPYQGKKKGADSGIDGKIYFGDLVDGKQVVQPVVVSVKGGAHVSVPMIRDLGHVVAREKAAIGLFVTLTEPTKPMRDEAVKSGFYVGGNGKKYPKIQILTIESLMNGTKRPEFPDTLHNPTFKKAKKEKKTAPGELQPLFED